MKALVLCDGYGKKQSAHEGDSNALFVLKDGLMAIDKLLLDLATVELRDIVVESDSRETIVAGFKDPVEHRRGYITIGMTTVDLQEEGSPVLSGIPAHQVPTCLNVQNTAA